MKLVWTETDTPFVDYTAEGESYSYQVAAQKQVMSTTYEVAQMRQPGGQVVNRTHTTSLEGAFARAQTWENDRG